MFAEIHMWEPMAAMTLQNSHFEVLPWELGGYVFVELMNWAITMHSNPR